jgi:hypothetical protein
MPAKWIQETLLACLAVSGACAADVGAEIVPSAALQPAALPVVMSDREPHELLAVDWELAPGTEQYLCTRRTLTERDIPADAKCGEVRAVFSAQ